MRVALIGYGEVGRILAEDLRASGTSVSAFDLKFAGEAGASMRTHAQQHDVSLADSHAAAVRDAELVISAVTASQAVAVARACAAGSRAGRSTSTSTPRHRVPRLKRPASSMPPAAATSKAR
jgi:3-hydroxyisobutyrate dehydrogenase-like beta-hydroxyacid dehydrogenase